MREVIKERLTLFVLEVVDLQAAKRLRTAEAQVLLLRLINILEISRVCRDKLGCTFYFTRIVQPEICPLYHVAAGGGYNFWSTKLLFLHVIVLKINKQDTTC